MIRPFGKTSDIEPRLAQAAEQAGRVVEGGGAEQPRSPDDPPARTMDHAVETRRIPAPRRGGVPAPCFVGQGRAARRDGRARDRPGAEGRLQPTHQGGFGQGEAEPESGEPVGLAERAQDHEAGTGRGLFRVLEIDECLIEHGEPARRHRPSQRPRIDDPSIRIVRTDRDHDRRVGRTGQIGHGLDRVAAPRPGGGVLGIGRADHRDATPRHEARQGLDQDLRAGCRRDMVRARRAVGGCGDALQACEVVGGWQAVKGAGFEGRQRVGHRIDAGREVDPRLGRIRKRPARRAEIAAMRDRLRLVRHAVSLTDPHRRCPGTP